MIEPPNTGTPAPTAPAAHHAAATPQTPTLATPLLSVLHPAMNNLAETTNKAAEAILNLRNSQPESDPTLVSMENIVRELRIQNKSITNLTTAFEAKDINIKTYIDNVSTEMRTHLDASIATLLTQLQTPAPDNWLANTIQHVSATVDNLNTRLTRIETAPQEDILPEYIRQPAGPSAPGSSRAGRH